MTYFNTFKYLFPTPRFHFQMSLPKFCFETPERNPKMKWLLTLEIHLSSCGFLPLKQTGSGFTTESLLNLTQGVLVNMIWTRGSSPTLPPFSQGNVNWHFSSLMRIIMRHYFIPCFVKTFVRSLLAFPSHFSPQVAILGFLAVVQETLLRMRTSQTPNWLCHKKTNWRSQTWHCLGNKAYPELTLIHN